MSTPAFDARYVRQTRFASLGIEGQARLSRGLAVICGCGALGTTAANWLVRAGVGRVRIIDRDLVDWSNLHRQVLFDEEDARQARPKAAAAAEKLRAVNSQVEIEPVTVDLSARNVSRLLQGADVVLDGTDNFETRFLINDYCVREGIPWIYGGCLEAEGRVMTVLPGETACLACVVSECPPPGTLPTCETAGVLGPAVGVVASWQVCEAMKILAGKHHEVTRGLMVFELWQGRARKIAAERVVGENPCRVCGRREFAFLQAGRQAPAVTLCGSNAVQVAPTETQLDPAEMADRWKGLGEVSLGEGYARIKTPECELTLFSDGRAIVRGTKDPALARSWYSRLVGL